MRELKVVQLIDIARYIQRRDAAASKRHAFERVEELVEVVLERFGGIGQIARHSLDRLVQRIVHFVAELDGGVQAAADGKRDEAEIGARHHVHNEDGNLLNARDAHAEHREQPVDGLFDARRCQLVDALRHIVWHGCHGAANVLDLDAGRKCLGPGRADFRIDARNGEQGAHEHEEQQDGPVIDPYLRKSSSKAKGMV